MTLREMGEFLWIMVMAVVAGAFGLALLVLYIAAVFGAIGLGVAVVIKMVMWAFGWPIW